MSANQLQAATAVRAEPTKRPTVRPPIPTGHDDVALIDINDVCALARMSMSWWHDEVRAGRAPQPLRYGPRCTRWRLADVRAWLIERAKAAAIDQQNEAFVTARAKKASSAAQAKRAVAIASNHAKSWSVATPTDRNSNGKVSP